MAAQGRCVGAIAACFVALRIFWLAHAATWKSDNCVRCLPLRPGSPKAQDRAVGGAWEGGALGGNAHLPSLLLTVLSRRVIEGDDALEFETSKGVKVVSTFDVMGLKEGLLRGA